MARLTASVWVSAYLKRLQLDTIPAYVMRSGDKIAGTVLVKCARLDGRATAHERLFDPMSGERRWEEVAEGPEGEIDALIDRKVARDPDLWVIEVESRDGMHLLDDPSLV